MIDVQLLVFEGCDLLDLGGPYEVLLTANRIARAQGNPAPFDVRTVSVDGQGVRAYGGLGLQPHAVAEASTGWFVVPGAIELDPIVADPRVMEAIRAGAQASDLLASVCTGSLLLAHAGALSSVPKATTHHEDVSLLAAQVGEERVVAGVPWVDAGRVVTAGGLSSGLAMALHLVDRAVSRPFAEGVAERLAYRWEPTAGLVVELERPA